LAGVPHEGLKGTLPPDSLFQSLLYPILETLGAGLRAAASGLQRLVFPLQSFLESTFHFPHSFFFFNFQSFKA